MLVSPAEPERLRQLGTVSTRPEKFGADFMFFCHGYWVGIQRKEISDLIASLADGRLAREVAQMQSLEQRVLIVEGRVRFTDDGEMMDRPFGQRITEKQWRGLLWSVRAKNIWVEYTSDMDDTLQCLAWLEEWFKRDKHSSLERRPGPVSMWGTPSNEDYQRHLIMGLPGVGPELAERIRSAFGGVPFGWRVTEEALKSVPGIGVKKAKAIFDTLEAVQSE